MTDLVYPSVPAHHYRGDTPGPVEEMLPIVDEHGFVVGQASRQFCHSGSMLLHPVVHLHIINRFGEIYLQRRSATKRLLPLRWDTAVGGHISFGEKVQEALFREASEELGFYDFNPIHLTTYVWTSKTERELVNVFAAVGNFELHPDNSEVCDGRYWTPQQLEKPSARRNLTPNFMEEYKMIKDSLQALL